MKTTKIPIRLAAEIRVPVEAFPVDLLELIRGRLTWRNPLFGRKVRFGQPVPADVPETLSAVRVDPAIEDVVLPKGYLAELVRLCHAHRYVPELRDETPQGFTIDGVQPDRENISAARGTFLADLVTRRFGILEGPPGSGRRRMMAQLARMNPMPMLVIAATVYELHIWKETCLQAGWDRGQVGLVGGGLDEQGRVVTIVLSAKLKAQISKGRQETGLLVIDRVDQVHLGPVFYSARVNCVLQWGLGVGPRSDGLTGLMEAYVGPRVFCPRDAATAHLPTLQIRPTLFACADGGRDWKALVTALGQCGERNRLIAADVLQSVAMGQRCLVVSDRSGHLQAIGACMREALGPDMEVLSADLSEARRDEVMGRFNACRKGMALGLVFRSAAMVDRMERIDRCFITAPLKQADYLMGIVMRMGKSGVLYEYKDREELLRRSFKRRLRVYRRVGIR